MNKQEVYSTVRAHLLKQGVQARGINGCMYRDPVGKKCAIGCLIKDEHYVPAMEGGTVGRPIVQHGVELSLGCVLDQMDRQFLSILQGIHDKYMPETWARELDRFAVTWNLQPA